MSGKGDNDSIAVSGMKSVPATVRDAGFVRYEISGSTRFTVIAAIPADRFGKVMFSAGDNFSLRSLLRRHGQRAGTEWNSFVRLDSG